MRKWTSAIPFTLAATLISVVPLTASAALVITEVQVQTTSGTNTAINGDWWELTNSGPGSVNLADYAWADTEDDLFGSDPNPNGFPSFTIAPGQSIIIIDETSASEAAWRTNWGADPSLEILSLDEMIDYPPVDAGGAFSGLGSANDAVYLYTFDPLDPPATTLVSSYSWVANTRGTTFEITTGGADLGLSVVGENGAVLAANGDVGSPGSAVPEPSSMILGTLAILFAAVLRRGR